MAKLYWRVKKDGKWTWRPAISLDCDNYVMVDYYELDQEEEE